MTIAGFTKLLIHTDPSTTMVDDNQVWLVKPILASDCSTHIRKLEFQTDDIGQV